MTEKQFRKGDYTYCGCSICEIVDEDDEVICVVATEDVEKVIGILEENEQLKHDATVLICSNQEYRKENEQLKSEIEKLSYANEDLLTQKRNWEKLSDEYAKVYEENEQLKSENMLLTGANKILKENNERLKEENQKLMKAVGESSRMAVETLLPTDEDSLTINGKWW